MLGPQRYTGVIRSLVIRKLEEIKVLEKRVEKKNRNWLCRSDTYYLIGGVRTMMPYNIFWTREDAGMVEGWGMTAC
jgi:hypothetical protein